MKKQVKEKKLSQSDLILYLHASAAFQLLNAGVELKLFELLHQKKTQTVPDIANALKLKLQSARCLVFGLVALRLIKNVNNLCQNGSIIERLFNEGEWKLFKSMVLLQSNIMYIGQIDFVKSLQQSRNVGLQRFAGTGNTMYHRLGQNPKLQKIFNDFMEVYSEFANPHLLRHINFSQDHFVLDVGGGSGTNAIALAKHYPNSSVILLDLPGVASVAKKKIEQHGLSDKIKFYPADMFKQQFPKNQDCVLLIHQLVIWSSEGNIILLRKAYESLKKNGRVIIFNSIADDSENGPLMAALDTVYFRSIAAGNGMIYPWKDYEKWLHKIGFKRVERIRCKSWTPHGIIVGYK